MEQTYDLSDPTIDSQLINLSKSGADVFYNISTGKASSQSIRKTAERLLFAGEKRAGVLPNVLAKNSTSIAIPRHPDHDEVRAEVGIFR